MKNLGKRVFLFLFLWASTGGIIGQTEKQIAAIRADVKLIDKSSSKYSKKEKDVDGISLEGARATYFLSGKGLKKIVAKIYGETFRATAEIYYSGEEMIFAFQRLEKYDTHIAMNPPPKVIKVIESRVYFSSGKAIRVIEDKKTHAPGDSEFRAAEEAINDLSSKLKAALDQ